jgi:hypothetical protein
MSGGDTNVPDNKSTHESGQHVIGMPIGSVLVCARDILNPSISRSEEIDVRFATAAKNKFYRRAFTRDQLSIIDHALVVVEDRLGGVSLLIDAS